MKHWECQSCGHDFWAPTADEICPICGMKAMEEILTDAITLRDFFAGCALIAEMLDTAIEKTVCEPDVEARSAFLIADAMLKERGV